jgi:4-amino-4-deoxy-L-arabinose transferase-like glycosyltransferase
MVHPYYTVALAPPVAGLVGVGVVWAWRNRAGWDGRIALSAMIVVTALWSAIVLRRNLFGPLWLPLPLAAVAAVAAAALLGLGARRLSAGAAAIGLLAAAAGTVAYSIATASTPHQGAIPMALKHGDARLGNWMGDEATNPDLAGMLAKTTTAWSAATNGSQSAAALEVSSGTSVMAIGGWSGDPVPTLQSFIDDVQAGKISYYVEAGRGRTFAANLEEGHGEVIYGPNHGVAHTREIAEWVSTHFTGTIVGESTIYRLT